MTANDCDSTLFQAYVAGDELAFRELHARHELRLLSWLRRTFRLTYDDAGDVAQQTWQQLHKTRRNFSGRCCFNSWLRRISFRVALQHIRAIQRTGSIDDETLLQVADKANSSPHDLACHNDLREAVNSLPERLRQIVTLVYWNDMSLREVAARLNVSESTIDRSMAEAKSRLAATA